MSKHLLFGQTIVFADAEDNYYELQAFFSKQISKADDDFESWYTSQNNSANVINNVTEYFEKTVKDLILNPLYPSLASKYEIVGVSKSDYLRSCLDISELYSIRDEAVAVYEDIQECMDAEIAEREEEEEWRRAGQISFGVGDSLKNAVSNAAHGAAKAGGNAASRERAAQQKRKLYEEIKKPLLDALINSLNINLTNHTNFVNGKQPHSIEATFDQERSNAYLDNAKTLPQKRTELLVEAFKACPWNKKVYTYIFKNCPEERKDLLQVAKYYRIDLTAEISKVFRALYTSEAKRSEALALEVKATILKTMTEWGVQRSVVIDEIENDCLQRIVKNLENATEEECNQMKDTLKKYDALTKNKTPFLKMVTKRIEEIWSKEDGEFFDNCLLNANILSVREMQEKADLVKKRGRTDAAKKYLNAFCACKDRSKVQKARTYQSLSKKESGLSFVKHIGTILIVVGAILLLIVGCSDTMADSTAFGRSWLSVLVIVLGIIYQKQINKMKEAWETITINGRIINPILNMSKEEFDNCALNTDIAMAVNHANNATSTETNSEQT